MHQPVAEEDVADAEALRLAARLLLAGERVDAFALGFRNRQRALVGVQAHVVYEALRGVLEILPQVLAGGKDAPGDTVLADDVLAPALGSGRKRQPASSRNLLMVMRAWASEGILF
jgi:hypothetical protein